MAVKEAISGMGSHGRYIAAMVLAGVGDSFGYNSGRWEFNYSGPEIHKEVAKLGGLKKLKNKVPSFIVSDDTVMHLATARALVTKSSGRSNEDLFDNLAHEYIKCMNDMSGRSAGATCQGSCNQLNVMRTLDPKAKLYRIPFNPRGGGCGGSMRSMCIGMRYPRESELDQLIAVSIESGRMTHNHPTGYLGSLVSALFTSYALQDKPVNSWGAELMKSVLPKAQEYITTVGIDVEENIAEWSYFEGQWRDYLALRQITEGDTEPVYPEVFGVEERDKYYTQIAHRTWGGASGHDSVIIAYDALLGSKGSWDELCNRGIFHGGDNDSTGTIAACWFGAFYEFNGVHEVNHKEMEYRDKMVKLANELYTLGHPK